MDQLKSKTAIPISGFSFRNPGDEFFVDVFFKIAREECANNKHDTFRKIMGEAAAKRKWKANESGRVN